MAKATIIQHVPFEGPARIAECLERRGVAIEIIHVHGGVAVPSALPPTELLVVLGGPMSVTDLGSAEFPFLEPEVALLRARLAVDAPTLGVCLGAQLLAHAAGARVYPHRTEQGEPIREVGWAELSFLLGTGDPVLRDLPERTPMFHWHGDTFDVPAGATLLASTERCRAQAFRLKQRAFGLQFHGEMERPDIERLLTTDLEYAQSALGPHAERDVLGDTERFLEPSRVVGMKLLENILNEMTR